MIHRPWPWVARLVARMADSSLQDHGGLTIQRPPRSPGLHASTLLRKLYPHPNEERVANMSPELKAQAARELALYGLMGLAFEDRAELALLTLSEEADWPWVATRTGEVHADGVACSPDILLEPKPHSDAERRELSLKVTWKSCNKLPIHEEGEDEFSDKFDYYIAQCMTYAYPLRTMGSVLLCYFVNGDSYKRKGAPTPQIHGWELDFSPQEISENWCALTTIAEGMSIAPMEDA